MKKIKGNPPVDEKQAEVLNRRKLLRAMRRSLRDDSNPFEIEESDFIKLYRIPKEGVRYIIHEIKGVLPETKRISAVPLHLRVLTALNFLASGGFQRGVGGNSLHALSQPSVSCSITQTCNAIVQVLMPKWIKFPKNVTKIEMVKQRFMEKSGMQGVIGAVDAFHIAIIPPKGEQELSFFNRKNYHSKNVQIVCNSDLQITSINAKYGGQVHDAHIWKCSLVREHLRESYLSGERNKWIIGDTAYPTEPWLLTPVNLVESDSPEAKYNTSLLEAHNHVKQCIGVLRAWFRCLKRERILNYTPERAGFIVTTCAVLHNIALYYKVPLPQEIDPEEEEVVIFDMPWDMSLLSEGVNVRSDVIRNNFS